MFWETGGIIKTRRFAAIAVALATVSAGAGAEQRRFDRLFAIGDSLSDGGAAATANVQHAAGEVVSQVKRLRSAGAQTVIVATMTALRQQALTLENRLNPTVLFSTDDDCNRRRRSVGDIDVYNINRTFQLGPSRKDHNASSDGVCYFGCVDRSAMLPVTEGLILNPFAHFTRQTVEINGFTEPDAAASLSFGDTEYTSSRVTAVLSAICSPSEFNGLTFNLRGSADYDLNDDDLFVSIGPDAETLAPAGAPRPDQLWGYLSAGAAYTVGPGMFVSGNLSSSIGLSGTTG